MSTKLPSKKRRSDVQKKSAVPDGGAGLGWGFAPAYAALPSDMNDLKSELLAAFDADWDRQTATLLAAYLKETNPADPILSADLCEFMRRILWEHMEEGISLCNVLMVARKVAARIQVSNIMRYAFVGIVASSATSAQPARTRNRPKSKTSDFIVETGAQLMHVTQFDEDNRQLKTNDEAAEEALETLRGLLPPSLVPAKKTLISRYQGWLNDQGEHAPRPAIGAPKYK